MSIKKKLGLGVASAALGLSLVGGGTWAAFSDQATINNAFASGTLDLEVAAGSGPINFDISNLKPGDSINRSFNLKNIGTLAIKEVWMDVIKGTYTDGNRGGTSNANDYLAQFEVDVAYLDYETGRNVQIVDTSKSLTLLDLVQGDAATIKGKLKAEHQGLVDSVGRINLAPTTLDAKSGLPVDPEDVDNVLITVLFKDNGNQNRFQNDKIELAFNLEATQTNGRTFSTNQRNGKATANEKAETNQTSPFTDGNGSITNPVDDNNDN